MYCFSWSVDSPMGITVGMPGIMVFSTSVSWAQRLFLFFFRSLPPSPDCMLFEGLLAAPDPHACCPADVKSEKNQDNG